MCEKVRGDSKAYPSVAYLLMVSTPKYVYIRGGPNVKIRKDTPKTNVRAVAGRSHGSPLDMKKRKLHSQESTLGLISLIKSVLSTSYRHF